MPNLLNLPDYVPAPPKSLTKALEHAQQRKAECAPLAQAVRDARWKGWPSNRDAQAPDVLERYRQAEAACQAAERAAEDASRAAAHEAFRTANEWAPKYIEAMQRRARAMEDKAVSLADDLTEFDGALGTLNRLLNPEYLQGKAARFDPPTPAGPMSLEFVGTLGRSSVPASDLPRLLAAVLEHIRRLAPESPADEALAGETPRASAERSARLASTSW